MGIPHVLKIPYPKRLPLILGGFLWSWAASFDLGRLPFISKTSFFGSISNPTFTRCPWQPQSESRNWPIRTLHFWGIPQNSKNSHTQRDPHSSHADRGRLLLRTPGPVSLGLAYVLLVETNPFPNVILPAYALRISLGTFSILPLIFPGTTLSSKSSKRDLY